MKKQSQQALWGKVFADVGRIFFNAYRPGAAARDRCYRPMPNMLDLLRNGGSWFILTTDGIQLIGPGQADLNTSIPASRLPPVLSPRRCRWSTPGYGPRRYRRVRSRCRLRRTRGRVAAVFRGLAKQSCNRTVNRSMLPGVIGH